MQRFTGTRTDFERLAPKGLVLAGTNTRDNSRFLLYHRGATYYFLNVHSFDPTFNRHSGLLLSSPIDGAWRAFTEDHFTLEVLQRPSFPLYRRSHD